MTSSGEAGLRRQDAGFRSSNPATARGRHSLLRVLFYGWAVVALAPFGHGEEAVDCDSLPESRRALCAMVQACTTVADEMQRQECFRAAADSLGGDQDDAVGDRAESDDQAGAAREYAEAAGDEDEAVVVHVETASEETMPVDEAPALQTEVVEAPLEDDPVQAKATDAAAPTVAPAEAANTEAEPKRSRVARAFRELIAAQRATDAPTLPRRFTAEVTAHHDLVRDRQLVVLDDALLFEGDRAASSRISVGDEVEVVKASSLRGRRYQITGPTKRPFDALRIRCERHELSVDNRRKCERMIGD